jgi:adenylate kinase family enzyme
VVGASGSGTTSLAAALADSTAIGWGDPLIPEFQLVIFLVVPKEIRLARLRAREARRYGAEAVAPGGVLHEAHIEFLDWAGRYDEGGVEMRSRALHEAWLERLSGPVLTLEGDRSVTEQLSEVEAAVESAGIGGSIRTRLRAPGG